MNYSYAVTAWCDIFISLFRKTEILAFWHLVIELSALGRYAVRGD